MPRPITETLRRTAVIRAAADWVASHNDPKTGKGGQSRGARAAVDAGTPITQQKLGWAEKGQKIGPQLAAEVAALYHTTPDGLVRYLLGEGTKEVPLRDIPGWRRAKQEAMDQSGHVADAWTWDAVDHVVLPFAPREADKEMVIAFAQLLFRYSRGSGVRAKVTSGG